MNPFLESAPFNQNHLQVSKLHSIYFEEVGNPRGIPILFVHGGPGAGFSRNSQRFFDLNFYRVIFVDQRGVGKSKPHLELNENTTFDLVSDFEKLRTHLKIEKWIVFGGSWGSTLSLVYAIQNPTSVLALVLRGIFLALQSEGIWLYQKGASEIFPEAYEKLVEEIPISERTNLIEAYSKRVLDSNSIEEKIHFSKKWSIYEEVIAFLNPIQTQSEDDLISLQISTLELHYFRNNCFLEEHFILRNCNALKDIPIWAFHGRYDCVCPMSSAIALKKALPHIVLSTPIAGHMASDPVLFEAIKEKMIDLQTFFKS